MGKGSSAVYTINYHFVWCPKYRKPILIDKIKEFLEEQLYKIAETKRYKILELKVMPDHIHLFVESDSFDSSMSMVKILKVVTSLRLFKRFTELSK